MSYTPVPACNFDRIKRKLPAALRAEANRQVRMVCDNPLLGEEKIGDLRGVLVHTFRAAGRQYLLAYWPDTAKGTVTLLALGGHEDFYRDLKRYLAN